MYRWWEELNGQLKENYCDNLKESLLVGIDTFVSDSAKINGHIEIGNNCMIGTGVILRGKVIIGDNVRIGYGVEIKDSVIREDTVIGPLCYLGNSLVERNVYLGALVRTSNHRLDGVTVKSWNGEVLEDTGLEKLGTWIKEGASLGVGVVILPGRIVPEHSTFGPNIVITRNYRSGKYMLKQEVYRVGS